MKNRFDLSGVWSLACDDPVFVPIAANLPGDNYSALLAADRIPDPFVGLNELDAQWPRDRVWIWRRDFDVPASMLSCQSVFLNCDSLDTCGEIRVNGQIAATSDNMFRRLRAEVKPLLRAGRNTLEVVVRPAGAVAAERAEKLPFPLRYASDNRVPYMNLVRKIQCQSGWDWGVCAMVSGVYGAFYLQGVNTARIEYANTVQTHRADGSCRVDVAVELTAPSAGRVPVEFEFNGETRTVLLDCAAGTNRAAAAFEVSSPRLWNPAGYGGQPLYALRVSTPDDRIEKRLGLRKLELITAPDAIGSPMIFRVNGVDIFAKGADWIPLDAMPERYTRERYDRLLTDAVAAHMNMLRVWGGGLYEFEDFYDLCDEKGILIWQDCMFACMQYPADPVFLNSVDSEIRHQVRRLRDHASLALWCGDNEMAGMIPQQDRDRYLIVYDRLNHTIEQAVKASDPTREFWPSSPCNGPLCGFDGSWHDDKRGDMHYWEVWHGGKSFSAYYDVIPRFCSEFGYQSFPCQSTVDCYTAGRGRNVTSPVMEHHQRNRAGNSKIVEMMTRYFRFPEGFENFVYLSQVQQAEAIQTGVEFWRHLKPVCMGTLYWQLNDNWPVASWSSIDYYGNWKQLHYRARRFYAPVIVTTFPNHAGKLEIWAVSDVNAPFAGRVTATLRALADGAPLAVKQFDCALNNLAAGKLAELDLPENPTACFMTLELDGAAGGRTYTHYNDRFFTEYKHCELPETQIDARFDGGEGGEWTLELTTDRPAFFVFAEFRTLRTVFDDNSFTLVPGAPRTLRFRVDPAVTRERLTAELILRDLRSSYRE